MSLDALRNGRSATFRIHDGEGTPTHERLLLIELAADLDNWPARNPVFRTALDRAAHDLLRLAASPEADPPPAQPL